MRESPHRRLRTLQAVLVVLVVPAVSSGCATKPVPRPALTCESPCGVIAAVLPPDTVEIDLRVDAGTKLMNATITGTAEAPCQTGVPVAALTINDQQISEGPAPLAPTSHLALRFPLGSGWALPSTGLVPPVLLDLDLVSPRGHRCLRIKVPRNDGTWARLFGELSEADRKDVRPAAAGAPA